MKIPQLFRHKKLLAATARRASAASAGMEFDGMPEPNMKLSRALLIVLLLHVVAVSGIIAFNTVKTRETSFVPPAPANSHINAPETTVASVHTDIIKRPVATSQREPAPHAEAKSSRPPSKDEHTNTPHASGKTYVVKKGDNPVTIAKKLKVSHDDLIALNHIQDPHKLRIGQKLLIPATPTKPKPKKTNE